MIRKSEDYKLSAVEYYLRGQFTRISLLNI